jgi:hypothetical protein
MIGQSGRTGELYNFGSKIPQVAGNLTLSANGLAVTNAATTLISNFVAVKP